MKANQIEQVWKNIKQLEGKTFSLPDDFDAKRFACESKRKAESHEWLYHCSNASGVLGILQSREIWLTNLKNVNDSEEAERIDASSYEKSYYVGCFTYNQEISEAHWAEYGNMNNGVLIGIKQNWIEKRPVFMTKARQKCGEETMRIFKNCKDAIDYKIDCETKGKGQVDPYYIFDFGFYQVIYDDELKKNILGKCILDFNGNLISGMSISQTVAGIIKSCKGWCKREGVPGYEKNWEDEKEVRLKIGVHRLSTDLGTYDPKIPYFRYLSIPFLDEAFDIIRIGFSPQFAGRSTFLEEIRKICPNSIIEII